MCSDENEDNDGDDDYDDDDDDDDDYDDDDVDVADDVSQDVPTSPLLSLSSSRCVCTHFGSRHIRPGCGSGAEQHQCGTMALESVDPCLATDGPAVQAGSCVLGERGQRTTPDGGTPEVRIPSGGCVKESLRQGFEIPLVRLREVVLDLCGVISSLCWEIGRENGEPRKPPANMMRILSHDYISLGCFQQDVSVLLPVARTLRVNLEGGAAGYQAWGRMLPHYWKGSPAVSMSCAPLPGWRAGSVSTSCSACPPWLVAAHQDEGNEFETSVKMKIHGWSKVQTPCEHYHAGYCHYSERDSAFSHDPNSKHHVEGRPRRDRTLQATQQH